MKKVQMMKRKQEAEVEKLFKKVVMEKTSHTLVKKTHGREKRRRTQ